MWEDTEIIAHKNKKFNVIILFILSLIRFISKYILWHNWSIASVKFNLSYVMKYRIVFYIHSVLTLCFCSFPSPDRASTQHTRKQRVHSRDHVWVLQRPGSLHRCSGTFPKHEQHEKKNKEPNSKPALVFSEGPDLWAVDKIRFDSFYSDCDVIQRMLY